MPDRRGDRSDKKGSPRKTVTLPEIRSKEVAQCVEYQTCTDAAGACAQVTEDQGGEKHGQARRIELRAQVPEREQRAGQQQTRSELRAQHPPARLVHLVERRLQVAAIERLFRQGDDQQLPRKITPEGVQARRMERHSDVPPP